jgi:hypothetical protein
MLPTGSAPTYTHTGNLPDIGRARLKSVLWDQGYRALGTPWAVFSEADFDQPARWFDERAEIDDQNELAARALSLFA